MQSWQSFEYIIDKILEDNEYKVEDVSKYCFKNSLTNGKHKPDKIIKDKDDKLIIISKKWQETAGTADEKIFYEIIKLIDLVETYKPTIKSTYILLGGNGWRSYLKNYYLSEDWNRYLETRYRNIVKLVTIDSILPLISRRKL